MNPDPMPASPQNPHRALAVTSRHRHGNQPVWQRLLCLFLALLMVPPPGLVEPTLARVLGRLDVPVPALQLSEKGSRGIREIPLLARAEMGQNVGGIRDSGPAVETTNRPASPSAVAAPRSAEEQIQVVGRSGRTEAGPASVIRAEIAREALADGRERVMVSFTPDPTLQYVVEFRDQLQPTNACDPWRRLAGAPHNGGLIVETNSVPQRFYRLRLIDGVPVGLFALLENDTGSDAQDSITSDPTVTGEVIPSGDDFRLEAVLDDPDGPAIPLITPLNRPQHFRLTSDELDELAGGQLSEGPHTLHFRVTDLVGAILRSITVPFHLDRTAPALSLELAPESDSLPLGDQETTNRVVTLAAATEPNLPVELFPLGLMAVADAEGRVAFANLPLDLGANEFITRVVDRACNEALTSLTVIRPRPVTACPFPTDFDGWKTAISPTAAGEIAGSVSAEQCRAVLQEGGSLRISLEQSFIVPATPSLLTVVYEVPAFDTSGIGRMKDAFEIALVDASGRALTETVQGTTTAGSPTVTVDQVLPANPDAAFNHTEGFPSVAARGVSSEPLSGGLRRVRIDLASLPPGSTARLILRLLNNDGDSGTRVVVHEVDFPVAPGVVAFPGGGVPAFSQIGIAESDGASVQTNTDCDPLPTQFNPPLGAVDLPKAPPNGIYAINKAMNLVRINRETGAVLDVKPLQGLMPNPNPVELYSLVYHPCERVFYAFVFDGFSQWLLRIDGAGAVEVVRQIGGLSYPIYEGMAYATHLQSLVASQVPVGSSSSISPVVGSMSPSGDFDPIAKVGRDNDFLLYDDTDKILYGWEPNDTGGTWRIDFRGLTTIGLTGTLSSFSAVTHDPQADLFIGIRSGGIVSCTIDEGVISEIRELFPITGTGGEGPWTAMALVNEATVCPPNLSLQIEHPADGTTQPLGSSMVLSGAALVGGYRTGTTTPEGVEVVFGEDVSVVPVGGPQQVDRQPTPESHRARQAFLSRLDGVRTESFELFARGDRPSSLKFGSTTAGTSGGGEVWEISDSGTTENGAYPGVGSRALVLRADGSSFFQVTFDAPQAAFGFFATDIEFNQFGLILLGADGVRRPVSVPVTVPQGSGGAFYVGVVDRSHPFTAVEFQNIGTTGDGFGFDDLTVGAPEQVRTETTPNRLVSVTVNGRPVDSLDEAGVFHSVVEVRSGVNRYEVVARDLYGQTATNVVTVFGRDCPVPLTALGEVTGGVLPEYHRSGFRDGNRVVYADVALRNTGSFDLRAPLYVGVTRISNPSVQLIGVDGRSADGIPYYDFTETLNTGSLNKGSVSAPRTLAFSNPSRLPFTYELVVLAPVNRPPAFTSVPRLEAMVGRPYAYDADAADPDGEAVIFSGPQVPPGATVDPVTGVLTWTPSEPGSHEIRLQAADPRGALAEQRFLLTAINAPSNRPPVFTSTPVTFARTTTEQPLDLSPGFGASILHEFPIGESISGLACATDGTLYVGTWRAIYELSPGQTSPQVFKSEGLSTSLRMVLGEGHPPYENDLIHADENVSSGGDCCQGRVYRTDRTTKISEVLLEGAVSRTIGDPVSVSFGSQLLHGSDLFVLDSQDATADDQHPMVERIDFQKRASIFTEAGLWQGDSTAPYQIQYWSDPAFGEAFFVANQDRLWKVGMDGIIRPLPVSKPISAHSLRFAPSGTFPAGLYLAENSGRIRRVTPDGQIHSFASGLPFSYWPDLVFNSEGNRLFAGASNVLFDIHPDARNSQYAYDAHALDPDFDALTYSLISGPAGMTIDAETGEIRWSPTAQSGVENTNLPTGIPVVPGAKVEVLAHLDLPAQLTVDVLGDLYVGHDDRPGTAFQYRVRRISPRGGAITEIGPLFDDPDAIAIDRHGFFTGVPGTILVGGSSNSDSSLGQISAVFPDGAGRVLLGPDHTIGNPASLQLDSDGRLLWNFHNDSRLMSSSGTGTSVLAEVPNPGVSLGLGPDGQIYQSDKAGTIRVLNSDGSVQTSSLIAGLGNFPPIGIGPGGWWGTDLYTVRQDTGELLRVTPDGKATVVGSGFSQNGTIYSMVFGPDLAMYVSDFTGERILRVSPTPVTLGLHSQEQDVTVAVSDGRGGVAYQSYRICVLPEPDQNSGSELATNSSPQLTGLLPSPAVVGLPYRQLLRAQDAEGSALTFTLGAGTPDGLQLEPVILPGLGAVSPNPTAALVSWTPTFSQVGTNLIPVTVRDADGLATSQTFAIEVLPDAMNRVPSFVSKPRRQIRLGTPYGYLVEATDPNGDALTFTLVDGPADLVLTNRVSPEFLPPGVASPDLTQLGQQLLVWTPSDQQLGPNLVHLRVADGRGGVAEQEFVLTVVSSLINGAPVIVSSPSGAATMDQTYATTLVAEDPDDDPVRWRLVSGPLGMSLDPVAGTLRWTPTMDQLGTNRVVVEVRDALQAAVTLAWEVEVGCVNRPPQIVSTPPTMAPAGAPYRYAPQATDPDGDTLEWTSEGSLPAGMTLDSRSGVLSWEPDAAQAGPNPVRLKVSDGRGGVGTQDYVVYVSDQRANRNPVISGTPVVGASPGQEYSHLLRASDPDGDTVTVEGLRLPTGAALTLRPAGAGTVEALIRWVPTEEQMGAQEFILSARDTRGGSAAQRFIVNVRANQPPLITSEPRTDAVSGLAYRYVLLARDPEGDALRYAFTRGPNGLQVDDRGRLQWTPGATQTGEHPVTVTVTDAYGASAVQSFTVTVAADTELPQVALELVTGMVNEETGQWAANLGSTAQIRVRATDNVGVTSVSLRVGTQTYPLGGGGVASIPVTTGGLFQVTGEARDAAGNIGTALRPIQFIDPNAGNTVFVRILSPTNETRLQKRVPVVATMTNVVPIVRYAVDYAVAGEVDFNDVGRPGPTWVRLSDVTLPSPQTALENVTVATFDPLALLNDSYVIRVYAEDVNGAGWYEPALVNVAGDLKFGEFRIEFTDLAVPLAGIPITVGRVYDSRLAGREGDFGHGWSLALQDARIRESVPAGRSFRPGTRVYLTGPDGRRVGFTFDPVIDSVSFFGALFRPRFQADPGVYDRLEVKDEVFSMEGAGSIGGLLEALDPYNPSDYTLVTRDGTRFDYSETSGLRTVTDLNVNRIAYTRDGIFHYAAGATDPDQAIQFVRDARGRITHLVDPAGKRLAYGYDNRGDLRSFTDQSINVTRYAYDSARAHFLTNIVDPFGKPALNLVYDATGKLSEIRDAAGRPVKQDFDEDRNTGTFTDARGNQTIVEFDERGNELTRILPGISTNRFAYDANNNLTNAVNERGYATNFVYDPAGNVTRITDALNHVTEIAYNDLGKPTAITNALKQVVRLKYDGNGALTEIINDLGFTTRMGRDALGRLTNVVDAVGNTNTLVYEGGCPCGRPGMVINPDGSFRRYEFDTFGRTNLVVSELGAETRFHHDESGRLLWTQDALNNVTRFRYDGPRLSSIVDALGRSTQFRYDEFGRTNQIITAEGGTNFLRHDANGNLTQVIDAVGNVTRFVYDSANRLTNQVDTFGHTNYFAYDAAGNRVLAIDRNGRKRSFAYDAMNRMTNEVWWEGATAVKSISYEFNALGIQTVAADDVARYDYKYDDLNRLQRVLQTAVAGQPDFTLLYTHTPNGQIESVTDNWGVRVGSEYDSRNRLKTRTWQGPGVDPARVDFGYFADGNRRQTDRYADLAGTQRIGSTSHAYDRVGLTTNITHFGPAGAVLAKYDYERDAAWQIKRWNINGNDSSYGYDRTGQLTNALYSAQPDEAFRYDLNGNRTGGGYATGGNNQLLADGTYTYGYDAEGSMTSRSNVMTGAITRYTFDHRNRLTRVVDFDGLGKETQKVDFAYDALNRRLSKAVNGTVQRFVYNNEDSWADLDGSGAITARYLLGARIDEMLARQRSSDGRGWYLTDHLGSVRGVADGNGTLRVEFDFGAFGEPVARGEAAVGDRFLFTGREYDSETGLYCYRARYLGSEFGRFVSLDPIGIHSTEYNLYRYSRNSPIIYTDPTGLTSATESAVIGASLAALGASLKTYILGGSLKDAGRSGIRAVPMGFFIGFFAAEATLGTLAIMETFYGAAQESVQCFILQSVASYQIANLIDQSFAEVDIVGARGTVLYRYLLNFIVDLLRPC